MMMRCLPGASKALSLLAGSLLASTCLAANVSLAQEVPSGAVTPVETPAEIDPQGTVAPVSTDRSIDSATPAIPAEWEPVPTDEGGQSAYGLFLSGRVAQARGDGERWAEYLGEAQALTPEQPRLRDQAFLASLFGGDLGVAARTLPAEGAPPLLYQAGRLVQVVTGLSHGQPQEALAVFDSGPIQLPHALAGLLLEPWVAAAAGDWDRATPPISGTVGLDLLRRHDRALILELAGRPKEAEAEWRALTAADPSLFFRQSFGEFLVRQGRRAEAVALYDAALSTATAAGGTDLSIGSMRQARALAMSRQPAPEGPQPADGAAAALTTAAMIVGRENLHEMASVYLRLALELSPDDSLRLALGESLKDADLNGFAEAALSGVSPSRSGIYLRAQLMRGQIFEDDDRFEEALTAYRLAEAQAPNDAGLQAVLAALLTRMDRHEAALTILNGPVLNTADQPFEVRFMRGAALERLGRIDEAEAELWAALQQRPDDPGVLNYLGYMWVDTGRRLAQGTDMIRQAHAAEPNNGNFEDSLGWALYRQGEYQQAVETLEQAVDSEPGSATINDHLGDAYWRVGRQREAGFQWQRVLVLDPDAETRAEVERKLAEGLGDDPGVPPAVTQGG